MVRKLAMAVSLAVGSTLSLSAYALGLGEIRTSSALNEKFKGEIELLSVEKGQLDTLKVGLAPPEVFARTGVERPFHLSQLRFRTLRKRDGRAVILVTSDVPIREPFLDFFVQVTWPAGKLVREYTVLLDPPVTTRRVAPAVRKAAAGAGAAARTAQRRQGAAPVVEPGGEYGPVRANETLWKIAERVRPSGVSVHQMMVALYRANPGAFLDGNINLLKKGSVLRVPEMEEIRAIGRREAVAEFRRLSEGWIADTAAAAPGRTGTPAKDEASASPMPEQAAVVEGQLRIAGAEPEPGETAGVGQEGAGGSDEVQALRRKLMLVEEQAATARQESEDLRERMAALERQLEEMKRLLQLRDAELAQLQARASERVAEPSAGEAAGAEEQTPPVPEAVAQPSGEAFPATEEAEPASDVAMSEPVVESVAEPVVETEPAAEEAPAEAAPTGEPAVAERAPDAVEAQDRAPAAAATPAPAPAARPAAEPVPFWRQWLGDNWPLAAGGGALVLALLGLMAARRRRSGAEQEPPSAAAAGAVGREEKGRTELDDAAAVAGAVADSGIGDTSFLSEYSSEDLQALHEDTTEVDPVAEADVYIAYGRYSQAEEILREAMKNGNQSAAVRHKMLEVYYATQKKDEFRKLAEEMVAAGQDKEDPVAWEHIQTMGRDLDRNNPLFAAATAAAGVAAATAASATAAAEESESDLSLDLSSLAEEVDSQLNAEEGSVDGLSNMDLELPSLQIEPGGPEETAEEVARADELSLEPNETELHTEMANLSELGDLDVGSNALDETLADLTGDLEGVMEDSHILDQPLELQDSMLSELDNLVPDSPSAEAGEAMAPPATEEDADSRIGDEVETKLELAKAFMEIGDAEGARSILQEVQEDGTPEQKQTAGELLAQLDG